MEPQEEYEPSVVHPERLVQGVVMDNRSDYITAEVNSALDKAREKVITNALRTITEGKMDAQIALNAWHHIYAIENLRRDLTKTMKSTINIGERNLR